MKYIAFLIALIALLPIRMYAQPRWTLVPESGSLRGVSMYVDDSVIVVVMGDGTIARNRSGSSWEASTAGLPLGIRINRIDRAFDKLYLSTDRGLFVSADTGGSWEQRPLDPIVSGNVYMVLGANDGIDSHLYVGCDSGAFRSTDAGNTWSRVFPAGGDSGRVARIGYRMNGRVHLAVQTGGDTGRIYRSYLRSPAFERADSGFATNRQILAFYFGNAVALAGSTGGIFRSTTRGFPNESWNLINGVGGGTGIANDFLAIAGEVVIAAGTNDGFMLSLDGGKTWAPLNDGLPADADIRTVARRGDTLYLCNVNGGVWRRSIDQVPPVRATIEASATVLCGADSIRLWLSTSAAAGTYHAQWSTGDTVDTIVVRPARDTTYAVVVRTDRGDSLYATFRVLVGARADAGYDTTICPGGGARIGPASPLPGATYHWEPSAGLSDTAVPNPTAHPDTTTRYAVTATDKLGCTTTDTIMVTVRYVPEVFVVRAGRNTLTTTAPRGSVRRWMLDGTAIAGAVDTVTVNVSGNYSVEVTGPGGRILQSPARFVDVGGPLLLPDLTYPYGVIGYDKRAELTITNGTPTTIVVDSITVRPDGNYTECSSDTSAFATVNSVAGAVLDRGNAARVFVAFRPQELGIKAATLTLHYTSVGSNGTRTPRSTALRVMGTPTLPEGQLHDSIRLEPIPAAAPGKGTTITLLVYGIVDDGGTLGKYVAGNRCVPYRITFFARSSLLHLESGKFVSTSNCPPLKVPYTARLNNTDTPGANISDLRVEYEGTCDRDQIAARRFLIPIPFTAMLGDFDTATIIIGEFRWLFESNVRPYEWYGPKTIFRLEGVCSEGNQPRLVEHDTTWKPAPKLSIAPNPVDRELSVEYNLPAAGEARLAIYDLHGALIRSADLDGGKTGGAAATIDVRDLAAGSYFAVLSTDGNRTICRFDVAH